jgi:hypothetical protein
MCLCVCVCVCVCAQWAAPPTGLPPYWLESVGVNFESSSSRCSGDIVALCPAGEEVNLTGGMFSRPVTPHIKVRWHVTTVVVAPASP